MSNPHDHEFSQFLASVPFDDSPRPEHAESLRRRVLAEFAAASPAPKTAWTRWLHTGRDIMRRPTSRLVAALVLVGVGFSWLFVQPRPAFAFADFIEVLTTAKTARFQMEVESEMQPKQKFRTLFLAPARFRQEIEDHVNISDFKEGKILNLNPAAKQATLMTLKNQPKDKDSAAFFVNIRDELKKIRERPDGQQKELGQREIDGRQAVGYRTVGGGGMSITMWGDAQTGLPIRIECDMPFMKQQVTMTEFEFNVELDESLFSLKPPEGYTLQEFEVDASPPKEDDLLQTFRTYHELSDGEFPADLNPVTVMMSLVLKEYGKEKKQPTDEEISKLMQSAFKIGRGFGFAMSLPATAEARYAGNGVKATDKDRPVFWYKPEGKKSYRVIYADLTVREQEEPPAIADAVPIPPPAKPKKADKK